MADFISFLTPLVAIIFCLSFLAFVGSYHQHMRYCADPEVQRIAQQFALNPKFLWPRYFVYCVLSAGWLLSYWLYLV